MTILVTGATGTIGSQVVAHLAAAGHPVRALTRRPDRAELPAGVEVRAGDLTEPATLAAALEGATALHLIALGGDDYRPLTTAPAIVDAAARAGVKRITVLTGTDEELATFRAVEASGLDWTHVRPAVEYMANRLQWADAVRDDADVRDGFVTRRDAMVHEGDVGAVIAAALTEGGHEGRTYAPTGPEAITRADAARTIGEVIGRPVRLVELSEDEVRADLVAQGLGPDLVDFVVSYEASPPAAASTVTSVVEDVTGRPPRSFRDWVVDHAAAFGG
ncbi:MAG TPA: NAD(P)H-binding protein [Acidimicrobiales bacterium]|nr:NAD(P)H-binding protein [Acidimicrobiales bacterium]